LFYPFFIYSQQTGMGIRWDYVWMMGEAFSNSCIISQ